MGDKENQSSSKTLYQGPKMKEQKSVRSISDYPFDMTADEIAGFLRAFDLRVEASDIQKIIFMILDGLQIKDFMF